MKKRVLVWMGIMMLSLAACANQSAPSQTPVEEIVPENNASIKDEEMQEMEQEVAEAVNVTIYYGNPQADGFVTKEMQLESLTPEALMGELAKTNTVSADTKVLNFSKDEGTLYLDLSKEFSQYVNMMGTSGEYIVMGGIVNTFLDAYEAEEIMITNEGMTLETGHAIYDKPLTAFAMSSAQDAQDTNAEPMTYRLKDEAYNHNNAEIYYPQFADLADGGIQDDWNAMIRQLSVGAAEEMLGNFDSYEVDYDIVCCDERIVSFLFEKEVVMDGRVVEDTFAISFDMAARKIIRMSDWGQATETVAYNLANNGYYKILDDDIDRETYDEYMKMNQLTTEEYNRMFYQFDYDINDLSVEPAGTSYVKDGVLIIIMDVPEAMGGTLAIDTGVQVRE